jgi:hypothetical protein
LAYTTGRLRARRVERLPQRGLTLPERREQRVSVLVAEVVEDVDQQERIPHAGRSPRRARGLHQQLLRCIRGRA